MEFLRRRGKRYWVVVPVPVDLHEKFGRKQIWRSLKTTRYETAKSYARRFLQHIDQLFLKARFGMVEVTTLNSMVAEFALGIVEDDDKRRREAMAYKGPSVPHPEDGDPREQFIAYQAVQCRTAEGRGKLIAGIEEYAAYVQEQIAKGEPEEVLGVIDACRFFMERYGLLPDVEAERELAVAFAQAKKLRSYNQNKGCCDLICHRCAVLFL